MKKKISKSFIIILECEKCRACLETSSYVSQYTTTKNKQNITNSLLLKKYCKFCRSHQFYKEVK